MFKVDIRTPQTNPDRSALPPKHDIPWLTKKPLNDCVKYTADHVKMFTTGIELLNYKCPRGASNIGEAIGIALFSMAAPAMGTYGVVKGAPGSVMGATATLALAVGYSIEWCGHQIYWLTNRTTPQQQREHLTWQFICRMHEMMRGMEAQQAAFFAKNPEQLINIVAITVAFLSRRLAGDQLKVGNTVLTLQDLSKQDEIRKGYFMDVCAIKQSINYLEEEPSEEDTWNLLMRNIRNLPEDLFLNPNEDAEWVKVISVEDSIKKAAQLRPPKDFLERNAQENTVRLMSHTFAFSQKIINDEVFKRLWREHPLRMHQMR